MNKKLIRLTEGDLRHIIKRSVNRVLREFGSDGPDFGAYEYEDYYDSLPTGFGSHAQSASDFDTDEDLLNIDNDEDFDDELIDDELLDLESSRKMGRIIRESIRKVMRESNGNIITCYGTREAITRGGYGKGSLLGDGVIYLGVGHAPEGSPYGKSLISVDVDVSNFYKAKNAQEAIAIARDNQEGYSGVLYHSNHDGDVCAIFDQSCIIGKSF